MSHPQEQNPEPLFSIITVTYNAKETLPATMKSVNEQTSTDYEHLIMDGASTDGTADYARTHGTERTIVNSEHDNGIYDAMNIGLYRARGKYVIFLNAGDTFHKPDTLELIKRTILENDTPGIVYGQTLIVDSQRNAIGPRHLTAPKSLTHASFKKGMLVCHQAFIALRRITGPFSPKYRFSADYEWCIHCLQHSRHNVLIDEYLIDYLNEGVTTKNHRASLKERYKIMCRNYGTLPTIFRHIGFAFRALRRKMK